MEFVVNILTVIVLCMGLGMTVISLPGNLIILLTAVAYGVYEGFKHFDTYILIVLLALYVSAELFEFIISIKKLKSADASKRASFAAFLGAVCGGIIGTGVIPIVGSLAGAVTGVFAFSYVAEYSKTRNADKAKAVAINIVKGQVIALIFKISIAIVMVITVIMRVPWHNL